MLLNGRDGFFLPQAVVELQNLKGGSFDFSGFFVNYLQKVTASGAFFMPNPPPTIVRRGRAF